MSKAERENVERHVREVHRHIARQLEIIEALRLQGYPTDGAERLLADLKRALQHHKVRPSSASEFRLNCRLLAHLSKYGTRLGGRS
jgi:hypothetical protein